jgi:prepilin-type N-terminal cleavage/methylation domain-containing protein
MPNQNRAASAFTLIELLVVIAIVAVLAGLIFSATQMVRKKGSETKSISNMRQIGVAMMLYSNEHDGRLPGRATSNKWPALLFAYLGNPAVYADPGDPDNYLVTHDPAKQDPVSDLRNNTSFIYNGFNDLGAYTAPEMEIIPVRFDQIGNTILLAVKVSSDGNFFMDFIEGNQKNILKLSAVGNGSTYGFADGSARFITQSEYVATDSNGQRHGDNLWLADKSYRIP